MAVAFDACSESHTGTTGSTSAASFTWNHTPVGTPKGVLIFTFVNADADNATSVTYGGVSVPAVSGGRTSCSSTEAGDCKAWFLGAGIGTGVKAVVVNRTNNANVMYAVAITVTAARNTETAGVVLQTGGSGTVAPAQQSVDDGSLSGSNSVRFAGCNYGGSGVPAAGAQSTATSMQSIDFGTRTIGTVRESAAGTGARNIGFTDAAEDVAAVHLAVRETAIHTDTGSLTGSGKVIAGTAARTRVHASTSVLTGQNTTPIVGTAAHVAKHASTGVLTGQNTTPIVGIAARTREHASTSVLTGQNTTPIVGVAARAHPHPSSGTLTGPGTTLAGTAARSHLHPVSGALVGQNASPIAGVAAHVSAFQTAWVSAANTTIQ